MIKAFENMKIKEKVEENMGIEATHLNLVKEKEKKKKKDHYTKIP